MRRVAQRDLPVTLAVSLHAPNDALRDTMIPINARYPLREVVDAAHAVARRHGRRVTFEYACIEGVNDGPELADELAELLAPLGPLGTHVNLIPLNPTAGFGGRAATAPHIRAFADRLPARGGPPPTPRHPGSATSDRRRRAPPHDPPQPWDRHRCRLRAAPGAGEPGPGPRVDKNAPVNEYRFLNP